MSEREEHVHVHTVIISVADEQAFAVFDRKSVAGEIVIAGCVLDRDREGLGQLARRVRNSEEDIDHCLSRSLARKIRFKYGVDIADPGHRYG